MSKEMNKITVEVPPGITKLSQWGEGFLKSLPEGKVIVNKRLTGCGATTYFLSQECPLPVVLCSHRTALLECKAKAPRHAGYVKLFKTSEDKTAEDLSRNMAELRSYLEEPRFNTSFDGTPGLPPKILVTADSFRHVYDVLVSMGKIDQFTVVSDEMQCIFTDAAFKGNVVLEYMNYLNELKNVIYLSATPYLENYLIHLDKFKDMPYVELKWPSDVIKRINVQTVNVRDLREIAVAKIKGFQKNGFFEENALYKATQGVFFFNSVVDIIKILNKTKLAPEEVNIICSRSSAYQKRKLKKAGYVIGEAQGEEEIHKTYTFVTKCSFEGVDFYHPSAYTYIFCDPNIDNLALDLNIDIPQILGRQRLDINPWRYNASIYYKTTGKNRFKPLEEFKRYLSAKKLHSQKIMSNINNETDPEQRELFIIDFINEDNSMRGTHYVNLATDPVTKKTEAVYNPLAEMAEVRSWDLKENVYKDDYYLVTDLNNVQDLDVNSKILEELHSIFRETKEFEVRLRAYCEFREKHPELSAEVENSIYIPSKFTEYYKNPGPDRCRAKSYHESLIKNEIGFSVLKDDVGNDIYNAFKDIDKITKTEAKAIIQEIYIKHHLSKKAKATDLETYFDCKSTSIYKDKKSVAGIKLFVKGTLN